MPLQSLIKQQLSKSIVDKARELGFFDCGISKAEHLPANELHMEKWLNDGNNGTMSFLERNKDKRYDPRLLVAGAKSVISVLLNYYPEKELPSDNNYKISKYAYGVDYHYLIKEKLSVLDNYITVQSGPHSSRQFVDSAPVLDREWAHRSGLGFIGKNTMLINKKLGSYFFIGHIITDLELDYNKEEPLQNYCGNCTKCIDACPTNAIKDNVVDARNCISYLTIEHQGELDKQDPKKFNDWIFGCDICQDVCPWNRFSVPNKEPLFKPKESLQLMNSTSWRLLDKSKFNELFKGSAVNRTRYKGLKRNIEFLNESET